MTITETDEETFQTTVTDFHAQIQPDACLPTAIKNILDELEERQDIDGLSMSQSDLNDLCGYREGFYSREEIIPEQLSHEISGYGYVAREASGDQMDLDALHTIIEDEQSSLPIVELDPDYFREVEGYRVQESEHLPSHVVIVFKVNDDEVLYYDPYENFFERSSRIEEAPRTWSKTGFFELWSGRYDQRWSLWIDRREEPSLAEYV